MNFGPYILAALCWFSCNLAQFIEIQGDEIDGPVTDTTNLISWMKIMEQVYRKRLSHLIVQFVVNGNSA